MARHRKPARRYRLRSDRRPQVARSVLIPWSDCDVPPSASEEGSSTYKGYNAAIEFDADDEIFTGRILGINDVVGFHATTVQGLKSAFHEAVDDYIEACAKIGKKPEREMSGKLLLRIPPVAHANASIAASLQGKSLNQWLAEVIERASSEAVPQRKKRARR